MWQTLNSFVLETFGTDWCGNTSLQGKNTSKLCSTKGKNCDFIHNTRQLRSLNLEYHDQGFLHKYFLRTKKGPNVEVEFFSQLCVASRPETLCFHFVAPLLLRTVTQTKFKIWFLLLETSGVQNSLLNTNDQARMSCQGVLVGVLMGPWHRQLPWVLLPDCCWPERVLCLARAWPVNKMSHGLNKVPGSGQKLFSHRKEIIWGVTDTAHISWRCAAFRNPSKSRTCGGSLGDYFQQLRKCWQKFRGTFCSSAVLSRLKWHLDVHCKLLVKCAHQGTKQFISCRLCIWSCQFRFDWKWDVDMFSTAADCRFRSLCVTMTNCSPQHPRQIQSKLFALEHLCLCSFLKNSQKFESERATRCLSPPQTKSLWMLIVNQRQSQTDNKANLSKYFFLTQRTAKFTACAAGAVGFRCAGCHGEQRLVNNVNRSTHECQFSSFQGGDRQ